MEEAKVKGFLFHYALDYVTRKWGNAGLEKLGVGGKTDYIYERWYSFDDFLDLLEKIELGWGDPETSHSYRIAFETMTSDIRWQTVFKGKDPRDLFLDTKYQNTEYVCGEFENWLDGPNNIVTKMVLWCMDWERAKLFAQFYHGQLSAVLKMTSRKGDIKMDHEEEEGAMVTYYRTVLED